MRKIIKDILPLEVPMIIFIDPSNRCNFKCVFCPTGDSELLKSINRPIGMMDMETYQKIINDLSDIIKKYKQKPIQISLFKDGEPLLNKNIVKMIEILSQNDLADTIEITTNASALNPKLSENLIKAGLKKIRYSIYHLDDMGYHKVTNNKISFKRILNNIKNFWELKQSLNSDIHVTSKILNYDLNKDQENFFKKTFSPFCDETKIEYLHGWSNGNLKDLKLGKNKGKTVNGLDINFRKVCSQPFTRLTILHNGDVTPCCVDWSHKLVAGNINKESLDKIWNINCNELRLKHLEQKIETDSPCNNCDYMLGFSNDENLDDSIDQLKKVYSESSVKV